MKRLSWIWWPCQRIKPSGIHVEKLIFNSQFMLTLWEIIFFQFHSPSMGVALSISRDWNHISFSLLSEWYLIAHQKHLRAQQKQPDSPPEIFLKGCQLISVELTDFSRMPPRNLTVLVPLTYSKKLQWPGIELGPTDQDLSAIPSELSWLLEMMSVKWTIYFAYFLNQYIKH